MGGFFKAQMELSTMETTPSNFHAYTSNTNNAKTYHLSILQKKTQKYKRETKCIVTKCGINQSNFGI